MSDYLRERVEGVGGRASYKGFGFFDVLFLKEKLSVEVGEIDGVKVDDFDVAKAGEDEVFEEFTTDSAGAYDEDTGGRDALKGVFT